MVLPQAMAWVQYWFRVLSLKFCGKSKKKLRRYISGISRFLHVCSDDDKKSICPVKMCFQTDPEIKAMILRRLGRWYVVKIANKVLQFFFYYKIKIAIMFPKFCSPNNICQLGEYWTSGYGALFCQNNIWGRWQKKSPEKSMIFWSFLKLKRHSPSFANLI